MVCAELCGIGHSTMRQFARVVPGRRVRGLGRRSEAGRGGGAAAAAAGGGRRRRRRRRRAALQLAGCAGCHTLAEAGATAKVGPDLGKLGNANAAFIQHSIVDPNADVTKGYKPNIMPQDFKDKLSKEELDALVKYLLEAQG